MGFLSNAFTGWHLVIILVIVVLLFGATRLPALAGSIGKSIRILRKESRADTAGEGSESSPQVHADASDAPTPKPHQTA